MACLCRDVELPFLWIICKPEIHSDSVPALSTSQTAHHVMNDVECNAEIEHTQEVDCVFSICPLSGVLEPSKSTDFQILFAPPVVSAVLLMLHLAFFSLMFVRFIEYSLDFNVCILAYVVEDCLLSIWYDAVNWGYTVCLFVLWLLSTSHI